MTREPNEDHDVTVRQTRSIDKLGEIPLGQQPGSMRHYSVSVDVQGYLVEMLSGQPFDKFLQSRIFEPLGMTDTAFYVPSEHADQLSVVYGYGEDGSLVPGEGFGGGDPADSPYLTPTPFFSGGGGLVASTMDYIRLCQMVLSGGEFDGVRLLSPLTIDLMHRNQLPRALGEMSPGTSFGLDIAVVDDPVAADGISKGEYYWGGAAGTWFWIDPVESRLRRHDSAVRPGHSRCSIAVTTSDVPGHYRHQRHTLGRGGAIADVDGSSHSETRIRSDLARVAERCVVEELKTRVPATCSLSASVRRR